MPSRPDAPLPPEGTLEATLGFEVAGLGEEPVHGRFEVSDRVRQPFGLVHGGAYAALAETLASAATYKAVEERGMVAIGQSNLTSYLRPVTGGAVHAEARARHRGRSSWVWEVDMVDDEGRLCAISRVTVAVRPRPAGAS